MARYLLVLSCVLIVLCSLVAVTYANEEAAAAAVDPTGSPADPAGKTPPKKRTPGQPVNWNKVNMMDIEKEWETGDAEEELEHEFEHARKVLAKKQPKFDMNDGASIQKAYKSDPFAFSSGGGMMIFIDLNQKQVDGNDWSTEAIDLLCKSYASLLRSGSVVTTFYNIGENRMLVNTDKVWQTKEILKFLSHRPEVHSFTANSKTYTTKEFREQFGDPNDEDDEDL